MTTDRSEQSGPEVVATVVHSESDASRVLFEQSCIALGCGEHPLITLSSHQQTVEALRAEVELLRGVVAKFRDEPPVMLAAAVGSVLTKRAESAEARLARAAGLVDTWAALAAPDGMPLSEYDQGMRDAEELCAKELAAAIAPQEES